MLFGLARVLIGLVFSLGLILVVVGGAELFTGNVLIIPPKLGGAAVSTRRLLRNWSSGDRGQRCGRSRHGRLTFGAGHYGFGRGAVGAAQVAHGAGRTARNFLATFVLGTFWATPWSAWRSG
ncbi:MAG: formate/nitrite transporter family protein [Ardenticatenia bacterium]|nr:formate/nitrite transporter family protein [Ardenticatenia bacterium]